MCGKTARTELKGDGGTGPEKAPRLQLPMALSKMNWNQSRLDGRNLITLQTADQVKQILRFCDPDREIATRYAQYM